MIDFLRFLVLFEIFLLPLIFATPDFGFEESKIVFFIFFNSLIGFLWWYLLLKKKIKFRFTLIKKAAALFLSVLFISSVFGIDPASSFLGKPPYFQGLILYTQLYLFAIMVSSLDISLRTIAKVLLGSAMVVSIIAIKEAVFLYILGIQIPNYAGRIISSFGQPNLYSGFLLFAMPFSRRYPWIFILIILAVILSYSRTAIFMTVGLLIWWLIEKLKSSLKGTCLSRLILGLVSIAVVISLVLSFKFSSGLLYEELQAHKDQQWLIDHSPEKRVVLWPVILEFISGKPILGHGLENLDNLFENYQKFHGERNPAYYGIKNLNIDRSHNYVLDLLVFSGGLGLLSWLVLVFLMIKKAQNTYLLIPLLIYLFWIQFQIQGIVHLLYFWLLVGMVDRIDSSLRSE